MRKFFQSALIMSLGFTLFLSDTAFSRGRRFGNGGFIRKGFNPCGWQTCGPRRRFSRRPIFPLFGRRMMRGGGCGPGGCGGGGGGVDFNGGGGHGRQAPRPIADEPFANEPPAAPDLSPNGSALGGGSEEEFVPAPALPEEEESAEANPDTLASRAKAIIQESCVSCHNGQKSRGGLDLSELDKVKPEKWKTAFKRVANGSMPEDKVLSEEDKKILLTYLEEKGRSDTPR